MKLRSFVGGRFEKLTPSYVRLLDGGSRSSVTFVQRRIREVKLRSFDDGFKQEVKLRSLDDGSRS